MESDADGLREQLREIERGETAAWVVYPPTPVWWPIGFGLWSGAFALVVGLLDGVPRSLGELGLVLLALAAMAWDRRRRGTHPSGRPPRELRPAIARLVVGAGGVASLCWLIGEQVGTWPAAVVATVASGALVARYEHEYAAVAAAVRERLA